MTTLKQKILEEITNNQFFKNILFCEIDDGNNSNGNESPEKPDVPNPGPEEPDEPYPDEPEDEEVVFDENDPNLKYYTYQVNEEEKAVEVKDINYSLWLNDKGDELIIPEKLGNYKTVLSAYAI